MTDHMPDDLSAVGRDLRAYTDELRPQHAIVKNTAGEWVLLRHAEVVAAALDHERFSSAVSRYLQVPNGLDGDEHSRYRTLIDKYLTPAALAPFVPEFERIAAELITSLPKNGTVIDAVHDIGAVFAVRAQFAWLGWPQALEAQLLDWMQQNHAATRSGEQAQTAAAAEHFDTIIRSVLAIEPTASEALTVTQQLRQEKIDGRLLTEAERVSILRNWTGGDLGSMALCVGVLVAYLVTEQVRNPELLQQLRHASNKKLELFIDEVLRLDNPFVSNRRVTTCPVRIAGRDIPEGVRVKLNWTSANRDTSVFAENSFKPKQHAANNLVYGIGKHVCPGRTLATWQLRIVLQALLKGIQSIKQAPNHALEREVAPVGGYHFVPVVLS